MTFKHNYLRTYATLAILLLVVLTANAGSLSEIKGGTIQSTTSEVTTDTIVKKKGFFNKILAYFNESNKEKPEKKFDVGVIGGPHYSSEAGLGLGLVGAGLYRVKGCSPEQQRSNVSLYANATTKAFFTVGIEGNTFFPNDKYRLTYNLQFSSNDNYFWGFGYDMASNNGNKIPVRRMSVEFESKFLFKIANNLFLGPQAVIRYTHMKSRNSDSIPERYGIDRDKDGSYGIGANLEYDSRDLVTNAFSGAYVCFSYLMNPKWMGNRDSYHRLEGILRYYHTAWKGAVIAGECRGQFLLGHPTWSALSRVATYGSLRGYNSWQYIDKNAISAQVEIRQHVWRRNGVVVWGGMGTIFNNNTKWNWLPSYGFGYRWEFKKRTNVRIDLGFGRKSTNFEFGINEAF